eukprot:8847582-Pyramimonas_sp.AAC.1
MPRRKRPAESTEALAERIGQDIERAKEQGGFQEWRNVYLEHAFAGAGHAARLGDYGRDGVAQR